MNFFSHFLIGGDYGNPDKTLGKLWPDFLRIIDKSLRLSHKHVDPMPEALTNLQSGIALHVATDRYFHASAWFHEHEVVLKQVWDELRLPGRHQYRYFFTHVLLEMLLDRVMIRRKPELLGQLYESLSRVDRATLTAFFRYKGGEKFEPQSWQFLQRFVESAYLYEYTDNSRLLFALDRVAHRVGLQLFAEPYKSRLMHRIDDMEQTIAKHADAIFEAIENHLVT